MTHSALRAKYISLVTDVIYEAGRAGEAGTPGWSDRAAALGVRASDLTAFVEALLVVLYEAQNFIPGPNCQCRQCTSYRTAISRLEELTKSDAAVKRIEIQP